MADPITIGKNGCDSARRRAAGAPARGPAWLVARILVACELAAVCSLATSALHAEPSEDLGGDLVERIEDDAPPASAPSAPPVPTPPRDEHFELSGWALARSEAALRRIVARSDGTGTPEDAWQNRLELFARARYARGRSFELTLSGWLSYARLERDSGSGFNGFNGATRGEAHAELGELYAGFYGKVFDLRVGQQRVAWGNSEFVTPNDIVNPRNLRNPLLSELELRHQPSPLARLSADLGLLSVDFVVAPYYTPDAYDVYGSNWAAIQADAPRGLRGLFGNVFGHADASGYPDLQNALGRTRLPARDLSAPVPSLRLAFRFPGWDLDEYYQYGFDGPVVSLDPGLAVVLDAADFRAQRLSDIAPLLSAIDAGARVEAGFVRRHHVGFDISVPIGSFVARADAAYESRRVFYTSQLTSYLAPSAGGVLGFEYQTGDVAKTLIAELYGLRVLEGAPPALLGYEQNNYGLAATVRWPLFAGFGIEPRAVWGLKPHSQLWQPQLTFKHESLSAVAGVAWLDGAQRSFGRYYRGASEGFVKLKLAF